MKFINTRVADEIRKAREERNLSQTALAARVGTTRASISNIERGQQSPSLFLFCRIAAAMDIFPPDLLKEALEGHSSSGLVEIKDDKIRKMIEEAVN